MSGPIVLGAVAYDPKVVTIWEGFRLWLRHGGLPFEYVLYPHYEALVDALVDGPVDVAWASPLAWVRARRIAADRGMRAVPVVMRDTDRDLTSAVLVRPDGPATIADLAGLAVATGARDSPQSHLIPLGHLDAAGLDLGQVDLRRFDVAVGKHGDHLGGERDAVTALLAGDVAAACVLTASQLTFAREGLVAPGAVRTLTETEPFDHCVLVAIEGTVDPGPLADRLLAMDYEDPAVRHLLDLEGLRRWLPGRSDRFDQLERSVDLLGFYDAVGAPAPGYDP